MCALQACGGRDKAPFAYCFHLVPLFPEVAVRTSTMLLLHRLSYCCLVSEDFRGNMKAL